MTARSRKTTFIVAACLVGTVAAGAGCWAIVEPVLRASTSSSDSGTSGSAAYDGVAAKVTKGDLTDTKRFAGTLGYGAASPVVAQATGTLTWLPKPGQVARRDDFLYAVDEIAIRLMHGSVPLWRSLERGLKGTDVLQLNQNLAALGYDVSVDDTFGPRTERAVKKWQKDRDQKTTGILTSADIAFLDGDVRVATVTAQLGEAPEGEVMTVTSTNRVATATVSQRDAERLAVGTSVQVRINGVGEAMTGKVTDVMPSVDENDSTKVGVSVSFDAGDRKLPDTASAQIQVDGATEQDVLSVPVAALLAGEDGSYSVDVVRSDGTTDRVQVTPGFIASGRIAVTGKLSDGDRVAVPG